MNRFEELRLLLETGKYFKLVCGAGNENADEVYKLSMVYTLSGANGFDVSAKPEIVKACLAGIDKAYDLQNVFDTAIPVRPFITVSVGMKGDHHVRKAIINDSCFKCNLCIPVCPTAAITHELSVTRDLCIGCGNCEAVCPPKISAIEYEHDEKLLSKILPACIEAGAENVELHAAVPDDEMILKEWEIVCRAIPDNFISMCLDRYNLSNLHLVERIKRAADLAGDRIMIQADGVPMSGSSDDYNTTLQAIAIADIIHKELIRKDKKYSKIPVLLSGGTNSHTGKLARQCQIPFNGVCIGTHARKIVQNKIGMDNFENDFDSIRDAVSIGKDLIERNLTND